MKCSCGKRAYFKQASAKQLLSSVGDLTVQRRYYVCRHCGQSHLPWDRWAGLDDRQLTPEARRLASLAGSTWSFAAASEKLVELCRVRISKDTIRRVCDEEGQAAARWMGRSAAPTEQLAQASGAWEFYSDGLKINTVDGWREMRLSVLAKREAAVACEPQDWADRVLPAPTARVAWAQIANCQRIGASWKRMGRHLGLDGSDELSVIADGARWIWDQAQKRLSPTAQWVVDVYHVSQRIHSCAKAIWGEGSAEGRQWAQQQLAELIAQGGPAMLEKLRQQAVMQQEAGQGLMHYLEENRDSLWYAQRLRAGQAIGSGLIEGACKTCVAARLKLNSARWRVRRAEHMAALRCLDYSGLWTTYWQERAA